MYNAVTIHSYAVLTDNTTMLFRSIVTAKPFVSDKIKIETIYLNHNFDGITHLNASRQVSNIFKSYIYSE